MTIAMQWHDWLALFGQYMLLSLLSISGAITTVPDMHRYLVTQHGWLTDAQFSSSVAIAQAAPGPNVINLALMIGDRYFGLRGAVAAVAGMLTIPLVVILALAVLYAHYAGNPQVAAALRGMGAVSGGLIAATGVKLVPQLRKHPLGFATCLVIMALVFVAIAVLKIPLGWVLLVVGGVACIWTWKRIAP